jgi:hypothetical protein
MRRLEIGSAKALVWVAVSLAVWGASTAAFAQTFDFSFSGSGGVMASGVFDVTGTSGNYTITGISGSVSGFANALDNGSIQSLLAPGFYLDNDNILSYPNSPYLDGNGGVSFTLSNGSTGDENIRDAGNGEYEFQNSEGGPFTGSVGTLSLTQTPAPIPGAGLLSYLAFGFGGLFINRKRLWRATRMALGVAA